MASNSSFTPSAPTSGFEPYMTYNFVVDFGGMETTFGLGGFTEVSGGKVSIDSAEYREGNEANPHSRKLIGRTKYDNLTMKYGVVQSNGIGETLGKLTGVKDSDTVDKPEQADFVTNITIYQGNRSFSLSDVPAVFCKRCRLISFTPPSFNASASEVAFDSLEFTVEAVYFDTNVGSLWESDGNMI